MEAEASTAPQFASQVSVTRMEAEASTAPQFASQVSVVRMEAEASTAPQTKLCFVLHCHKLVKQDPGYNGIEACVAR